MMDLASHRSSTTSPDLLPYMENEPHIPPRSARNLEDARAQSFTTSTHFLPTDDASPPRHRPSLFAMPSREELIKELKQELSETYTEKYKTDSWEQTASIVKSSSDEMVDRWNKEIDALLTYAGLFSAVLTAFNVQSYQLLQPPSTDPALLALAHISAQLTSFTGTLNPPVLNSTRPAFDPLAPSPFFQVPLYAIWLNICWFSSLVFSLAAASLGIMVKQWLNNYSVGLSGTSREIAALRQHRLNSLHKWKIPMIVAMLPVLLQAALVLFLIGLVILLWTIHLTVAVVVAVLVGILLTFTFCTIILPAVQDDCCYLSPQAFGCFLLREKARWLLRRCLEKLTHWTQKIVYILSVRISWRPLRRLLYRVRDPLITFHSKLLYTGPSTWHAHEQVLVTSRSARLEGDMMASAYAMMMNPSYFDMAAACLADHDHIAVIRYHDTVLGVLTGHWGGRASWPLGPLNGYVHLASRVLQRTLAATPAYPWEEATNLLVLARQLSPDVFELLDLQGLVRSYAVLAMGQMYENKEAFRFVFRALEPRASWRRPCGVRTLWFAAAAAGYRMDAFRHSRSALDPSGDLALALDDYSDAVRLAVRCIARPIVDADTDLTLGESSASNMGAPRPGSARAMQECVHAVLASFLRFLKTPVWTLLCSQGLAHGPFRAIVEDMQHLRRFAHSRPFVTDAFLEALMDGLQVVRATEPELVGDAAEDGYQKWMGDVLFCEVLIEAMEVR